MSYDSRQDIVYNPKTGEVYRVTGITLTSMSWSLEDIRASDGQEEPSPQPPKEQESSS